MIHWGAAFATDEYIIAILRVGNLMFGCVDFGGYLELSTVLMQKLRVGGDVETKKCTGLAIASGAEWASQGQPKRLPSRRRIDVLASSARLDEFLGAEQAREQTIGVGSNTARAIQSICPDILIADRERDYQALGTFLWPSIWNYLACEVAIVEIVPTHCACFHTYPAGPTANESVVFLISYLGHMMWGKPAAAATSATWRDWRRNVIEGTNEAIHPETPWNQRVLKDSETTTETPTNIVKPCNRCDLKIKVGFTRLSAGAISGLGNNHCYPKSRWKEDDRKRDLNRRVAF